MARQVQLRRGTTAQTSTFTGAVAEVTVDTDKNTVVIHDGSTAGGHPITSDQTVVLTDGTGISTSGTYPNFTITNSAPDQTVVLTDGTGITTSGTCTVFLSSAMAKTTPCPSHESGSFFTLTRSPTVIDNLKSKTFYASFGD